MTSKDVALLVLGGIIGAVFNSMYETMISASSRGLRRTRAALRRWTRAADDANVRYYASRNLLGSLYKPQTLDCGHQPLLHNSNLTFDGRFDPFSDGFISFDDGPRDVFPVKRSAIWRARLRGVRLFDGDALYVKAARILDNGNIYITAARCNYLSYASQMLELRPRRRLGFRRSTTRERYLSHFDEMSLGAPKPQVLGCWCVTLVRDGSDQYVAIATRSHQVLTSPGAKCVLPTFGLESNIHGGLRSQHGLLFHNYLREFAEEFFGIDDLTDASISNRSDPDWIQTIPAVRRVVDEANAGRLRLEVLDLAVGVEDAGLGFVVLAEFDSSDFSRWLRREVSANWETSESGKGLPLIQFVRLDDPRIVEWARDGKFAASSVFALDVARSRCGFSATSAESQLNSQE